MHAVESEQDAGEMDVWEALLERDDTLPSWGFELRGGVDSASGQRQGRLAVSRVSPGSPAARIGLKAGDEVVEIGDTETEKLTQQQAQTCIAQYGLSLILTVERQARGFVPHNPVLHGAPQPAPLKSYQTFNMSSAQTMPVFQRGPGGKMVTTASPTVQSPCSSDSGVTAFFPARRPPQVEVPQPTSGYQTYDMTGAPRPAAPAQTNRNVIQFHTARAMPFSTPASQLSPKTYQPPAEAQPTYTAEPVRRSYDSSPASSHADYGYDDGTTQTQSRTFRILQGLMENEAVPPPSALSPAAPPPPPPPSPRAPPVVNKQYNTPMTLYSRQSVVDSVDVDGLSIAEENGGSTEPHMNSDVLRMVQELDEDTRREKQGERAVYTKLGRKLASPQRATPPCVTPVVTPRQPSNDNPFAGASVSYRAYARKFAPPGGSTAAAEERERRARREVSQNHAAGSESNASAHNSQAEKRRTMAATARTNEPATCNGNEAESCVTEHHTSATSHSADAARPNSYVAYATLTPGPFTPKTSNGTTDF